MANPLDNVTCGNNYTDAATIGPVWDSNGGYFIVTNQDVYAQLGYQAKGVRDITWMAETHVPTGNGTLYKGTIAIRFRNYTAGSNASVSGQLSSPTQPVFTVGAGGVATPSTISVLTGTISSAGAITAGTGFKINSPHSTGLYVITFNTPYAAAPNPQVTAQPQSTDPGNGRTITAGVQAGSLSTAGFTVQVQASNGALIDRDFTFTVVPTV